ncbi:MAG: hypothetical protein E7260_01565 [Lachnospiraceae bacterium]|nr:hypothetical protein [Lachnospiraceae bacterium]
MNHECLRAKTKKIYVISALAVFVVISIVFGIVIRIFFYEKRYVMEHAELNDFLVKEHSMEIARIIQDELQNGQPISGAEYMAVSEILVPLAQGNQKFYIFASEEELLFFQNEQLTANRDGYTLEQLLDQFEINGGEGFWAFSVMLQTQSAGSVRFSISKNSGKYIGLVHTFEIEGKSYICIYCISESFILNIANAGRENILMIVVFLLLGSIITASIVFFCFYCTNLNRIICENDMEIERKNYIIDQFGQKVYHVTGSGEHGVFMNEETGIYTEDFLYNVLTELQLKQEKQMMVVVFGFRGNRGYQEKLTEIFKHIWNSIGQKELLFHIKNEHLVLLAVYDNDKNIPEEIQLLNYILQEKFKENHLVVNSVYAVQKNSDNLYKTLEQVIREYQMHYGILK